MKEDYVHKDSLTALGYYDFAKAQSIKDNILEDTKDYGRIQFIDEICRLQRENQQLKNAVADYEKTEFEKEQLNSLVNSCQEVIRQLKKQLEEKEKIACNWKDSCLENAGKIEKLENQQKEFIKCLEYEKNRLARGCSNICEDKFDEVNDILQKYLEIIGGKE